MVVGRFGLVRRSNNTSINNNRRSQNRYKYNNRFSYNSNNSFFHRFTALPSNDMPDGGLGNGPHGDVTIDIPLNDSPRLTQTGSRSKGQSSPEYVDEKSGAVARHRGLPGRRRKTRDDINESTGKPSDSPEDGTINRMGRFYQAILNYSIITRYLLYVTPIGILIAIPIIVGATVAREAKIGGVHIYWFFAWIEVVWVSLWTCKVFARFLPYLFQFLCGIVSSGTRKYALILRALETPITIVFWCIISLVTFLPVRLPSPFD
jgi:hypothetical protein